jgi:biotin synthase
MTMDQISAKEAPHTDAQMPRVDERYSRAQVLALYALPMNDLLFQAASVHRQHFNANAVQISTLLSIKTGGCPENCSYCPQSVHFDTGLKAEKLMSCADVQRAFVWVLLGAAPKIAMCKKSPKW